MRSHLTKLIKMSAWLRRRRPQRPKDESSDPSAPTRDEAPDRRHPSAGNDRSPGAPRRKRYRRPDAEIEAMFRTFRVSACLRPPD